MIRRSVVYEHNGVWYCIHQEAREHAFARDVNGHVVADNFEPQARYSHESATLVLGSVRDWCEHGSLVEP